MRAGKHQESRDAASCPRKPLRIQRLIGGQSGRNTVLSRFRGRSIEEFVGDR
jgi:hypothetical protein